MGRKSIQPLHQPANSLSEYRNRTAPVEFRVHVHRFRRHEPQGQGGFTIGATAEQYPVSVLFIKDVQAFFVVEALSQSAANGFQLGDKILVIEKVVDPVQMQCVFQHQAGGTVAPRVNRKG